MMDIIKLTNTVCITRAKARVVAQLYACALLLALSACASIGSSGASLYTDDQWAILPISNNSSVASAADVSESIIETHLRAKGVEEIQLLASDTDALSDSVIQTPGEQSVDKLLQQVNEAGVKYAVTGTVEQWGRSKLNGRDARVQLALNVYDASTGAMLWKGNQSATDKASLIIS